MISPGCRVAVLIAVSLLPEAALAELHTTITVPGSAFVIVDGRGKFADAGDGRHFSADAHEGLTIEAPLKLPPANVAESKMIRFSVHFSSKPGGADIGGIEVASGPNLVKRLGAVGSGDFSFDTRGNVWDFTAYPVKIGYGPVIRLSIRFPGGFDTVVTPGEFVLRSVSLDVPRLLATGSASTTAGPILSTGAGTATPPPPSPSPPPAPASETPVPGAARPGRIPYLTVASGERVRLDWCREWGSECGKPAADAFCRLHGRTEATEFEIDEDVGRTAIIGSGAICDEPGCDGFSRLECRR